MDIERPDLSHLDPAVRAYVEFLEGEVERLRQAGEHPAEGQALESVSEPAEPPTSLNIITVSQHGSAKRTPRHLYSRQRRGGMGVFDLETAKDDPPTGLLVADESQRLILMTDRARAFPIHVSELNECPVRSRGQSLFASLPLEANETPALVFPVPSQGYVALLSRNGYVRCLRYHYLGENLRPGTSLYSIKDFGPPVAVCSTPGDADLFIATRQGRAIRFPEKLVPLQGCSGVRLEQGDVPVAIASVYSDSGVFLVGADGRGTIRLMAGFSPNKAPGGGGKAALRTGHLAGAVTVNENDDLFILSKVSKIIRFRAAEVPAKEDVVQGVNCMALRADEIVAVASSAPIK